MRATKTRESGIPRFSSDEEATQWWDSEEGQQYIERAEGVRRPLALKHPDFIPITIRLPADLRERIRGLAAERGMGYQTLARQWLLERCREEEGKAARPVRRRRQKVTSEAAG